MQIVIDIDEDRYDEIHSLKFVMYGLQSEENKQLFYRLINAVQDGTPIPDNATNGDVIKVMFDTTEEDFYDEDRMVDVYGLDRTDDPSTFYADWWNAPYQKGGK